MKILMINVVCGIRSTGRICADLAEELNKQGHRVKIAYGRGDVPKKYKKYAVRIGSSLDVNIHALKARLFDAAGFGSKWYTKQFIKWVEKYDPDVIHLHNLHGYYINIEVLFNYLRTCGKKIIWTLHDCWAFTGHSALCDADGCEKWKRGCESCPQKHVYPSTFVDRSRGNWIKKRRLFTNIPDFIIVTPSKWLGRNVKKSYLRHYPIKVIPNGIDTDVFRPSHGGGFRKKYQLTDKFIILGVSAVWSHKKGFEDFCVLAGMLDDGYKIVLIGVEEKIRTGKYENLLTLGLTGSITELVDIYSSADVFVNLSYCDTFPTVNLEARACGLPIVTYNTGGSPEAAGEEMTVVEKGNIELIAMEIKKLKEEQGKCMHKVNSINTYAFNNSIAIKTYVDLMIG